jgi:hypothetical protein
MAALFGRIAYLPNSIRLVVSEASTNGQFLAEQVIFVFGELSLSGQYAAAEYCSKRLRSLKMLPETAVNDFFSVRAMAFLGN